MIIFTDEHVCHHWQNLSRNGYGWEDIKITCRRSRDGFEKFISLKTRFSKCRSAAIPISHVYEKILLSNLFDSNRLNSLTISKGDSNIFADLPLYKISENLNVNVHNADQFPFLKLEKIISKSVKFQLTIISPADLNRFCDGLAKDNIESLELITIILDASPIKKLTNLRRLLLRGYSTVVFELTKLTSLSLDFGHMIDKGDFNISKLTNLKSLELINYSGESTTEFIGSKLKELSLTYKNESVYLGDTTFCNLERFYIDSRFNERLDEKQLAEIAKILTINQSSLNELSLKFNNSIDLFTLFPEVSKSKFHNLEKLYLKISSADILKVLDILKDIECRYFRELHLTTFDVPTGSLSYMIYNHENAKLCKMAKLVIYVPRNVKIYGGWYPTRLYGIPYTIDVVHHPINSNF